MPLRCQSPTGPVFAFLHDAVSWNALRDANAKQRHLTMPCCQAAVSLKRSPLGTQFFAHVRAKGCDTKPESREHLLAKERIAQAAVSAHWGGMDRSPRQHNSMRLGSGRSLHAISTARESGV
jgi:hypothetical protein